MAALDSVLIEALLHMSESDVLDFKRDQYPFAGATDEQKCEIVKDILAFANAWKAMDAHILIGVDENPGGRARVSGVANHLNDADVQQLVNSKTNVPVSFEYVALTIEGQSVGAIRIRKDQNRPVFLKRSFGRLKASTVYVRRGSSTAEADPDEIARMGAAAFVAVQEPQVSLELADPNSLRKLGMSTEVTSRVLSESPRSESFDAALPDALRAQMAFLVQASSSPKYDAGHRRYLALFARLGFWAKNTSRVLIEDARVLVEVPKLNKLQVLSKLPEHPMMVAVPRFRADSRFTDVKDARDHWEIVARLGKIQPDAAVWSRPFWFGSPIPQELSLVARVFADNISTPVNIPLMVTIQVEHGCLNEEESIEDDPGE